MREKYCKFKSDWKTCDYNKPSKTSGERIQRISLLKLKLYYKATSKRNMGHPIETKCRTRPEGTCLINTGTELNKNNTVCVLTIWVGVISVTLRPQHFKKKKKSCRLQYCTSRMNGALPSKVTHTYLNVVHEPQCMTHPCKQTALICWNS
jgi:hypothetical protein